MVARVPSGLMPHSPVYVPALIYVAQNPVNPFGLIDSSRARLPYLRCERGVDGVSLLRGTPLSETAQQVSDLRIRGWIGSQNALPVVQPRREKKRRGRPSYGAPGYSAAIPSRALKSARVYLGPATQL